MLRVDQGRVLAALEIPGAWAWVNGDTVTAGPIEEMAAQKELCRLEGAQFIELGAYADLMRGWILDDAALARVWPSYLRRLATARARKLGRRSTMRLQIIEQGEGGEW